MVERMDETVGWLMAKLDELQLRDSTLVVFTSDNGGHTHSRNQPLRGEKATIWEGGIRVPCIARWPGVIPAGKTTAQVSITMDWTATFRRLAGVARDPYGEDGMDLMPGLTEEKTSVSRTLFWRRVKGPVRKNVEEGYAVRHGNWKLIEQASGERYLFDLAGDIAESTNVWGEHPDIQRSLQSQLDKWRGEVCGLK
jgi:arylsulfatase A-like enzyme